MTAPTVPPITINFAGCERTTVQSYTALAGRRLGTPARYVEAAAGYAPSPADTTAMVRAIGATRISVEDGVQRVAASVRAHHLSS